MQVLILLKKCLRSFLMQVLIRLYNAEICNYQKVFINEYLEGKLIFTACQEQRQSSGHGCKRSQERREHWTVNYTGTQSFIKKRSDISNQHCQNNLYQCNIRNTHRFIVYCLTSKILEKSIFVKKKDNTPIRTVFLYRYGILMNYS